MKNFEKDIVLNQLFLKINDLVNNKIELELFKRDKIGLIFVLIINIYKY